MSLNTITSDARCSRDITNTGLIAVAVDGAVDVAVAQHAEKACGRIQCSLNVMSRFPQKARVMCFIKGHSPWYSNKRFSNKSYSNQSDHKISLLSSNHMQRKNSSFSLSRQIQNQNGSTDRIRYTLGEVKQRNINCIGDTRSTQDGLIRISG